MTSKNQKFTNSQCEELWKHTLICWDPWAALHLILVKRLRKVLGCHGLWKSYHMAHRQFLTSHKFKKVVPFFMVIAQVQKNFTEEAKAIFAAQQEKILLLFYSKGSMLMKFPSWCHIIATTTFKNQLINLNCVSGVIIRSMQSHDTQATR